jgi:uncharacterized protein (UPF0335 family)
MMYKNSRYLIATTLCTLLLSAPVVTQAASSDELAVMRAQLTALTERLDRLEAENRALTSANAEMLKNNQQTAVAVAEVTEKTAAVAAEVKEQAAETDWTDSMRWKGDFRYRFESFDIEGKPNRDRNRAGLTNTHILGGKFSNFIHKAGKNGLLWDGDWRPEGTGIAWDNGRFFANGLGTWIESDSNKGQSFAYLTQAGVKIPLGDSMKLTTGIGYHRFNTKGNGSYFGDDDDFFGNSFNPDTNTYLYNYEELELFADLGFSLFDRPALVFANYVQNQAADDDDTGYAIGINYGSAKNKGQWAFGYVYQKLEADAVLGLLTDSDFGGGGTDSDGHILKGSYAFARNLNANMTYFMNNVGLNRENPIDYKRLQLELIFKY